MQYNVSFGSALEVDQFGFVREGTVTTRSDTVVIAGKKSWSALARAGVFLAITVLSLILVGFGLGFIPALFVIHYFCASDGSLVVRKSTVRDVQRKGRQIKFRAEHPESGEYKKAVLRIDTEENARRLEGEHKWEIVINEPSVEILGVYRLSVTEELLREQFELLYDYSTSEEQRAQDEQQCREQLASVVLIEAIVHDCDDRFKIIRFTQPQDGVPEDNWQVAYAEAYLTPDGEALVIERWSMDPPESADLRVAFFLHFWQPDKPLRTPYGDITCPPVQEMPERLARLVPYEPVD